MNTITWSSKLNTGVKKIDEQHRRLVKLVNNLVAGIQEGFADDITDGICRELIEYTNYHFRDEEMLMEEVAFPDIEAHKQKHASLTTSVQGYHDALEKGEPIRPEDLLNFLSKWLIEHIIHTDMQIGRHIRNRNPSPTEANH